MHLDIKDRTLMERSLRQSEKKYRWLFESIPDAIIITDSYGQIVLVNSQTEKMFGYKRDELVGTSVDMLVPDRLQKAHVKHRLRYYTDPSIRLMGFGPSCCGKCKDGTEFPVDISLNSLGTKDGFLVASVIRDITKRKQAEKALQESEEKFRTLFEESIHSIYIATPEGKFIDMNHACLDLFGFSREELLKMKVEKLYVDIQDRERIQEQLNKDNFVKDFEVQLQKKDKTIMDCLLSTVVRKTRDGKRQYQGIIRDVSDRVRYRKELERALKQAKQAEKLKTLFLANMSHEIRTPLNSILGFTALIKQEVRKYLEPGSQKLFDIIEKSGNRLIRTVHEILDLSQIEAGTIDFNPKQLLLTDLVETALRECKTEAAAKGLEILFITKTKNSIITADESNIVDAIINLVENAVKYTNRGKIEIVLMEQNSQLIMTIKDTGIGMSEEYISQMYDTFSQESTGYTKKFQGLGLGLAITKRYLDMNGVTVDVDSTKGIGTTFTLTFKPVKERISVKPVQELNKIATKEDKIDQKHKPIVLVVEDDPNSQRLMDFFLRKSYETRSVVSVSEAKNCLLNQSVDLILLDLSLEGDEDGIDLVKYLRKKKKWKVLPVIAVTAHAFSTDRQNVLKAGCNDYLSKPVKREYLLQKIKQFI